MNARHRNKTSAPPRSLPALLRVCLYFAFALGVLLTACSGSAAVYSVQSVPNVQLSDKSTFVSNPDGILSPEHVRAINLIAGELRERMGIELAVVAVRDIGDNDARMFATELFRHWGLGRKNEDNGLLIQLVTEPAQRSVVFEVGYGLEAYLPDAVCFRLQQRHMIPDLKNGDYSSAMLKGVAAVKEHFFSGEYRRVPVISSAAEAGQETRPSVLSMIVCLVTPILAVFVFVALCRFITRKFGGKGKGGGPWGGGGSGGSWGGGGSGGPWSRGGSSRGGSWGGGGGSRGGSWGGGSSGGGSSGGSWGGGSSGGGGSISRF